MSELKSVWMETSSGGNFEFVAPTPSMVNIEDIAEHLSKICRFNGACRGFYSVAEHSVLVSRAIGAPKEAALLALLHDAHEAYIGDITRPVKVFLSESTKDAINLLACRIDVVIWRALNIPIAAHDYHSAVKKCDDILLCLEAQQLMPSRGENWAFDESTLHAANMLRGDLVIQRLGAAEAKDLFLREYAELTT